MNTANKTSNYNIVYLILFNCKSDKQLKLYWSKNNRTLYNTITFLVISIFILKKIIL